ncbi:MULTISPECIES: SixA phosphatase family protein [unclassified Modestobacter]|uniref:SixA phosphatase family protein n=1 Tax=unclassified Modestobacter TaxID=2643866 RepID=UPI0022AAB80F|nr:MULTISPECIES: histidine phosphatase family protein [unclassified Modestobacter]MCZ2825027.1 histidine phosphatase family protein [Modestobacter sp. VKM Ac-2981]MCZ2854470.1 histidine phosphatase family protein [Modestobacter sp. VKM Ac-2982]
MPTRRLVLVRHAEAGSAAVDADRPLTDAGAHRATAIGVWLADNGVAPARALVSPARRTVQTWERAGGVTPVLDPRVQGNTVEALLQVVRETPDEVDQLAVVGHNPSISVLAALLDDGQGDDAARSGSASGFPAGGVAVLDLSTPFAAVGPGSARLSAFAVPGSD